MSPVAVGLTPLSSAPPAQATFAVVRRQGNPAPYGWQVLTVRSGDTVSDIAIRHRTTAGVLITRNHLADGGHFLAVGRHLSVPRTKPVHRSAPAQRTATYVVRSGDTLGGIAARSKISLAKLYSLNKISPTAYIQPGQRLRVPARAVAAPPSATYVVRSGDTLGGIATRFKVSLAKLYSLNKISRTAYIQPGQRLRVPASAARARAKAATAAFSTRRVTVRPGDTLSGLAMRYSVSTASLLKANGLSLRSVLQIGQKLKVVVPVKDAYSGNTFAGRTYPDKVVRAAAANRAYLARHHAPSRIQMKAMIAATARRHGIDPRLALAISSQESGWNQRLVSVANAIGAMQVIPSSGAWASTLAGRRLNLLDAQDNVTAGVIILRSLTRSAKTQNEAIAGYYQGLYSVQKQGMFPDTKRYVASIVRLKRQM